MGGQQSRTRKLTVENDDPANVIKFSEDVVQRIRNNQGTKPAAPEPPYAAQQPVQPQPVQPLFIYEPSVTSVQLRQANLAELQKNDRYWENRLKSQQANHQKINEVLESEYQKAMQDMEVTEKANTLKATPPCQEAKKAVMQCYNENAKEPMNCSKLVKAFQACVDSKRASIIASRG